MITCTNPDALCVEVENIAPVWIRYTCMMPCLVARQQLNEYIWNPLSSENNWLLSTIVIGSCTAVHCTAVVQELKKLQGSSYNTVAVVIILFPWVPFV